MDTEAFERARRKIVDCGQASLGIGTLGEKTLHAVIKEYMEPEDCRKEVKVGRYVADVAEGDCLTEIQTRNFSALNKKLEAFLPEYKVRVVYPVPREKWVLWVDEQTGAVSKRHKSPKLGLPMDVFYELCRITKWVSHPNFSLLILLIDMEEYRLLNGWSHDKKRGSTRFDRLPLALRKEVELHRPQEYATLLPQPLPKEFTIKELQKACKRSPNFTKKMCDTLCGLEVLKRCGKRGRAYLYALQN